MPSRSITPLLLIAAAISTTGCQRTQPQAEYAQLAPDPLLIDEAMQRRTWDRSTAHLQAGDVEAGPTRAMLEPRDDLGAAGYTAVEIPIFLANVLLMPVTLFTQPPGSVQTHQGMIAEPTYTAMPPSLISGQIILEPEAEMADPPAEPEIPPAEPQQ